MKLRIRYFILSSIITLMVLLLWTCGDGEVKYHNNLEMINALSTVNIDYEISSLDLIHNQQLTSILSEEGDTLLFVPKRTPHLNSFPCSKCHSVSLNKLKSQSENEVQNAHWNIELIHADVSTMNCQTCHSENDVEQLNSITGESIEIDRSYAVCGQCHSTQFKDWKGGGHGKRMGGWVNPRISLTCVNCHNPHKPSFEKRWPSRHNTVKIKELER